MNITKSYKIQNMKGTSREILYANLFLKISTFEWVMKTHKLLDSNELFMENRGVNEV